MTPKQAREAFQRFRDHGDFEDDVRVRQVARELSDLTGVRGYDGQMFRAQVAMFLYAAKSIGYELVPEASWKRLNEPSKTVSGRHQQT
jgi:hypothetical protein